MRQNEPEVVLLPEKDKRLTAAIREKSTEGRSTFLQAYPNPSSGPVYLTYSVVEGVENASQEEYTEQGQLSMSKTLGNSNGIAELNTQHLAPVNHAAVLYFDGLRVGTAKVNMVR